MRAAAAGRDPLNAPLNAAVGSGGAPETPPAAAGALATLRHVADPSMLRLALLFCSSGINEACTMWY
jgi:hypothetical protein